MGVFSRLWRAPVIRVASLATAISCGNSSFTGTTGKQSAPNDVARAAAAPRSKDHCSGPAAPVTPTPKSGVALADSAVSCTIEPTGAVAVSGVYSVIVTKPAPCKFKLPVVKVPVSGQRFFDPRDPFKFTMMDFPIGSYFGEEKNDSAHNFRVQKYVAPWPRLDNGFLLIQPDHKSYLLIDAGYAQPKAGDYKSAAEVANMISQTLGFGDTELLQPNPGSKEDNYASATEFAAGSVIALYDDTPDMGGKIEVTALLSSVKSVAKTTTPPPPPAACK